MVRSRFFENLDFEHGEDHTNFIEVEDIAEIVDSVLNARIGTVIDEINLSPQKKVLRKKESGN